MVSIGLNELRRFVSRQLFFVFSILALNCVASVTTFGQEVETDLDLFFKAEIVVSNFAASGTKDFTSIREAEKDLKTILQRSPDTSLRYQITFLQTRIGEIIGPHDLAIAEFYQKKEHGTRGAESRLKQILLDYPGFSKTDEVLSRLVDVEIQMEKSEDAAVYLSRLICEYAASVYARRAFERLNSIGWKPCTTVQR